MAVEMFLVGVLFVVFGGSWLVLHKVSEWRRGRGRNA